MEQKDHHKLYQRRLKLVHYLGIAQVVSIVILVAAVGIGTKAFSSAAYSGHHARCDKFTVTPTSAAPGATLTISIAFYNDGTTTYSPDFAFYEHDPYGFYPDRNFTKNYGPGSTVSWTLTMKAPSAPGSYKTGAQIAIAFQGPVPNSCPTRTVTVVTPTPPPPTPTPTPTPTPKPTPKPGGGSSGSGSSTTPDTTPPSVPTNFTATADDTTKTVQLHWDSSTDDRGLRGYAVDRSTDQQNWTTLNDNLTDTTYQDDSVSFGTHFYYRLKAIDTTGNASAYALVDVTTGGFVANAHPDTDNQVTSDDKTMTITIPKGALDQDAFCIITDSTTAPPSLKGYKALSRPLDLVCRTEDGTTIDSFAKPLTMTAQFGSAALQGISQVHYYGHSNWEELKITSRDDKKHVDSVALGSHTTFVAMGKLRGTPLWVKLLKVFIVLGVILGVVLFGLRFILKRKAEQEYAAYLEKSRGW